MRVSSSSTMAVIAFRRRGSKPTIHCCSSSSAPVRRQTQKNARLIPPHKRIANTTRLPEPSLWTRNAVAAARAVFRYASKRTAFGDY
jgi:hypothetical protein